MKNMLIRSRANKYKTNLKTNKKTTLAVPFLLKDNGENLK